jgi:glucose/arabinose dehydrogenase
MKRAVGRNGLAWRVALMAAATFTSMVGATPAHGTLQTNGFRAVGVALSTFPISAMAVAPDGRLFAAVQARGQTMGTTPGTAEIRVYSAYQTGDGATLDRGIVWATVDGVRATTVEEGLLGIALAPDFPTSKLVYVYLTTTDESVNQHVRVFRENASGTGDFLGTVATTLEPPTDSTSRNGAHLTFGVDGCLYVGVGDNGGNNRWNAQLLLGTDPIQGSENTALCGNVCLGPSLYPNRTVSNDGELNHAGKILRLAVEGASTAQPGSDPPLPTQPYVFGAGLRNPAGLAVHPLTGQLYVAERGDAAEAEIGVVDAASNHGWPCLEGSVVAGVAACLLGLPASDVYGNHPDWRRPLATHTGNPVVTGLTAYTGLGYPWEYYGDVFYLLRDSARIYRLDLQEPCFLPHPGGMTPIALHDSTSDGDFVVVYDTDNDGDFENVTLTNLVAIVQAPNPLGQQVLYVAGKTGNGNGLTEDTVIFRIEYATGFLPYPGPYGRIADSCFTDGVYSGGSGAAPYGYENPFHRETCLPPGGPCPGAPDGTSCDDGDPCNGLETCSAGICRHGSPGADGTACTAPNPCLGAGSCQGGRCVAGGPLPDGTPCPGGDPCTGLTTCSAGVCQVSGGGPSPLTVRSVRLTRAGTLAMTASVTPAAPLALESSDAFSLELRDGNGSFFSATLAHPASDPFWRRKGGGAQYADKSGSTGGLTKVRARPRKAGLVQLDIRGRHMPVFGLDDAALSPRLTLGNQCFVADLNRRCALDAKKLRCR